MVIPPWEKDEHPHMKSRGFTLGHVDAELRKKIHKLPWELDDGDNSNPKESRTFDLKYPDNKWNGSPWNRKPGANRSMTPPPPRPKIIREAMSCAAPFATKDNMVIVKYGEGKPSLYNNILRRRQRAAKPFVETHCPFERDEYDPAGKLPKRPNVFPRDINTYKPWPIPHAEEKKLIDGLPLHCDLKEGHQVLRKDVEFYPGDPTKKPAAGDVERVAHPRKQISYPRDPATLNPFPYGTLRGTFHFADEPADKNQKYYDQKQGHRNGWQFYPGDPSKMPAAGQKPPPKLLSATCDVNAAYYFH
ncbi:uncharacterized protein [Physcomitrium patens]|nr:uncharacterized protein LOC112274549 [Physcomitrium patens]|eukprot:XP_024359977.1 uncharacterized protein LOC112274549 [Physcomitrella patens]